MSEAAYERQKSARYALSNLVQLSANLGRNLMEGRLGIVAAVFEAASTKTWIYTEDRS